MRHQPITSDDEAAAGEGRHPQEAQQAWRDFPGASLAPYPRSRPSPRPDPQVVSELQGEAIDMRLPPLAYAAISRADCATRLAAMRASVTRGEKVSPAEFDRQWAVLSRALGGVGYLHMSDAALLPPELEPK